MIPIHYKSVQGTINILILILLCSVSGPEQARAQSQLSDVDFAVMTQSTFADSDGMFLWALSGFPDTPAQTINYSSTATGTSWSGALGGQYLGQTLGLTYSGNFTAASASWSTTGTFGGNSVTGSGTTSISYPTSDSFILTFSDSLTYGGNTWALVFDIPGTSFLDGTFMFGSPGNEEAGSGTLLYNGLVPSQSHYNVFSYKKSTSEPASDVRWDNGPTGEDLTKNGLVLNKVLGRPQSAAITQEITLTAVTVPEPSPLWLGGAGVAMVMFIRRLRCKQ